MANTSAQRDTILDNMADSPQSVTSDGETTTERSMRDLIEYDNHMGRKTNGTRKMAFRLDRMNTAGATGRKVAD